MESTAASSENVSAQTTEATDAPSRTEQQAINELEIDGEKVPLDKLKEIYKKSDSLNKSSYQRFQEAAKYKKEAEEIMNKHKSFKERFSNDFESIASEFGVDPIDLAEKIIRKAHEDVNTPDEIRNYKKMEKDYQRLKNIEAEREEQLRVARAEQLRERVSSYVDQKLSFELKNAQMDGAEPIVIYAAAADLQEQLQNGTPFDMLDFKGSVDRAIKYKDKAIRKDPKKEIESYLKNPEFSEYARQLLINSMKEKNPVQFNQQKQSKNTSKGNGNSAIDSRDFRRGMEELAKQLSRG